MADPFPKRVLAVGAHPDDLEILAGGTLAKYGQRGCHVSMAVATDGSAGHMLIHANELAEIRRHEAAQAAALINADFFWLGFSDEHLFEDIPTRMRFIDLIRAVKPDVILTHNPQDYHPDHRAVSRLIFDSSFISGLPNVKTDHPFHPGVVPLLYFDSFGGTSFLPNEYVDISETFGIKCQMLALHQSQVKWLKDHDQIDVLNVIEITSRSRGLQCGVEFAEAFACELSWPRSKPYRMLP